MKSYKERPNIAGSFFQKNSGRLENFVNIGTFSDPHIAERANIAEFLEKIFGDILGRKYFFSFKDEKIPKYV